MILQALTAYYEQLLKQGKVEAPGWDSKFKVSYELRLGPDGQLAIGGDLSVDRLILAYSNGIFPWYAFREKVIQWWCPLQLSLPLSSWLRICWGRLLSQHILTWHWCR